MYKLYTIYEYTKIQTIFNENTPHPTHRNYNQQAIKHYCKKISIGSNIEQKVLGFNLNLKDIGSE